MPRYIRVRCSTCDRDVLAYVPSHARNGALVYRAHNNRLGGMCLATGRRVDPEAQQAVSKP